MTRKEFYEGLSSELKTKIKACKTEEEMLNVLKDADIELGPELLESVSGGTLPPDCNRYNKPCETFSICD